MAVVSPMLDVMPQQTNPTRNPQIEVPRMMATRHEIIEEPPVQVAAEDKIYVAVGKELKENKSTVLWALHNSGGRKICLLHVHEPAQWIPLMGTKFPVSHLEEHQVKAYRETEKQDMNKLLSEYSMICERAGVSTDVVHTTKDSIDKGIVELISQHSIKMLVMGAAADRHYSRKMMQTKSKKAAYVHLQAPLFCRILFVCKGHLVHTREGRLKGISTEVASPTLQANPNNETGQPSSLRSRSVTEGLTSSGPDYRRARSDIHGMRISTFSSDSSKGLTPHRSSNTLGSFNDWEEISRSCPPLNSLEEASNALTPRFFSEFSFSEIEEATCNFDPSLKIGEGGYGSIYKGLLRHTQVAIKMLKSNSSQGPSEFQQEVNILSKLRHPNLVTLIGACPEFCILVYEYYPNGSLEDRLLCKDNTPPLTWQTRIRIAAELCSVLVFLHSCNPHSIVHGDLKPANILIDANLVSKLSDFGICRVLTQGESSSTNTTLCCRTNPKGTLVYMDPEFLSTGELTPKSDVYSFGIILLQLLTGRSATGIAREVQYALDKGNLKNLLDSTAGDWPFVQAKQLAHLAIRCCELNRRNRPDLASEVWRVLEPMRASCGAPTSFRMSSEEHCQIPSYFICPIFQEIMQDPHVAADGFTYELEALKGWLDGGHDTSPMTNLKLPHCNLVPNHALRSAIQEWLQQ